MVTCWGSSFQLGPGVDYYTTNSTDNEKCPCKVPYAMIGVNPKKSDATTKVGVDIYPINVNFGSGSPLFQGSANVSKTIKSPLFQADSNYGMGGAAKQDQDAMFRAQFWGYLHSSGDTNYNVVLGSPSTGSTFGFKMPSNSATVCTASIYVLFHDGCGAVYCVTSGNQCVGPYFAVIDPNYFQVRDLCRRLWTLSLSIQLISRSSSLQT